MNRKHYSVLLLVLSVSVLLLGLSYSKDSSTDKYNNEFESYDGNLMISTSDNIKEVMVSDAINRDISVLNKGSVKKTFVIEVLTSSLDGLSYAINDGDKLKLEDPVIYTQEIDALGSSNDNDFVSVNVKLFNENSEDVKVTLNVHEQDLLLKDKVIVDKDVYREEELENYRYYGENPNNYVKYNNKEYRIVGLINNRLVLISNEKKSSNYNPEDDNYLTILDYLLSFNNREVNVRNVSNYISWLDNGYWLLDTYGDEEAYYVDKGINSQNKNTLLYARKIIKLDINTEIILGDGSKNNPYEVVYDG